ncbi:MAG: DUF3168 domain-containing protein [Pseudomonadota bacterium]
MTYAASAALQAAVYQHLSADAGLTVLVPDAIHDARPEGPVVGTHVVVGDEQVRDWSTKTGRGAEHRFVVSVVSDEEGYLTAKTVAGAITDALIDAPLLLARGHVVCLGFLRGRARRVRAGQVRRIDLTFRALVEDT